MRGPSLPTIKRLFSVSGNRCAFPGCHMPLIDTISGKVIGQICHIKARRPGEARYDPTLVGKALHAFENLILLCPTHHKIVDKDEKTYPVERMLAIKAMHEEKFVSSEAPTDQMAQALQRG